MLSVKPETNEALQEGRLRCLVFFDFEFMPKRAHCGEGSIEWEGHGWDGVGEVLRTAGSSGTVMISSSVVGDGGHHRGYVRAGLPLDATTREVISKGYYRGRKMELFLCSLDEHGKIIERVCYATGSIAEMRLEGNIVTVIAKDDMLDSVEEKDARRRDSVEDVRAQFREKLSRTVTSGAVGWFMNLLAATVDWPGILIGLARQSNRRALAQRCRARKRTYKFTTEPIIPYKWWERKKGYAIRADTLAEAKQALGAEVARRIWRVPRGWLKMLVWVDGRGVGFVDLDKIRQASDPERWKATDPVRQWGRGE